MELSHIELQQIYNTVFEQKIKDGIVLFLQQDLEDSEFHYSTEMLWETDALVGGTGGYCMPANPIRNPFPKGIKRELYRPLQYARSNIDITDVRMFARFVVESVGMHLEAVCRLYLEKTARSKKIRFDNSTLGKAVQRIEQEGVLEDCMIEALYNFVAVYNRSKHEVNQDETRDRLFNAADAVVAYFVARVLGCIILQKLGIKESFETFEICKYGK